MFNRSQFFAVLSFAIALSPGVAHAQDASASMSLNPQLTVVPAPGAVTIDGKTDDWDLSAGNWSYNTPAVVENFSVWTHMMWDQKGIYFLARYADKTPMQNATRGKDFGKSWTNDAYQARVIMDDKTPDEHQMHINLFYSTPEVKPYLIVYHGGFGDNQTGPERVDLKERFGETMEKQGGQIAIEPWADDKKGYNVEAFWPWSYLRLSGQPLKAGDEFVFGMEAMWGSPDGTSSWPLQRLADGVKDEKANRVFMFWSRNDWGKAVLSTKGNLNITAEQKTLQNERLSVFADYKTYGTIPLSYVLPEDREVTIAIDDAAGKRVRNLFGQYPRTAGKNADVWDGLDDAGKPVTPGHYTATILDHKPLQSKFVNSVYNAGTPPWITEKGKKTWGPDHGFPISVGTRGKTTMVSFTGVEGGTGLVKVDEKGIIQWADRMENYDVTLSDEYAYTLAAEVSSPTELKRVIRRYNLQTGAQIPFEDAPKSVEVILPGVTKAALNSSIAQSGGKIYVLIPGAAGTSKLIRMDAKTGEVEKQTDNLDIVAISDREDSLFAVTQTGTVLRLNADGSRGAIVFATQGFDEIARLAISQDKTRFAISDMGNNQVKIFDAKGKLLKTLGKAYEAEDALRPAGKFVTTDFARPIGLDFDAQGRLWVAEASGTSRRVTVWSSAGELIQQFWGGADYGAMAGFPLTFDSTRFIAHGTEFQLDPNPDPWNRPTSERPLTFHPELAHERGLIYRLNGHEYAMNTPGFNAGAENRGFFVALRDKDGVFRPVVKVKFGQKFDDGTAWTDLNLNGKSDPGEITDGIRAQPMYWSTGWIRPDLTLFTPDGYIYAPKKFTPAGVPIYDFGNPVLAKNYIGFDDSGSSRSTPIIDNAGNISDGIKFHTVDGRQGSYPNPYGRHDAPAARRGRIIAAFRTNGVVEDVPGAGSITAVGGDRGEWFLLTMDGLYISNLWQDIKGDVTLDETYIGPESFGGFVWRDNTGKVLAQLGGNSYRIMEIKGLETVRKNKLEFDVTAAQIQAGQRLAAQKAEKTVVVDKLVVSHVAQLPQTVVQADLPTAQPLIAGATDVETSENGDATRKFRASLAHDGTNLAIMYQVSDTSPWKNGESRPAYSFIGGDAVDLKLDVPGRGVVRLLTAPLAGNDTAVYWQKTAAQKENPQTYVVGNNMGNAQQFDVVRTLPAAKVQHLSNANGYTVLVTVPLSELGLKVADLQEIKGDIGVIFSDPAGKNRVARLYLFDKSTGLVSDVPSESSLNTNNWGRVSIQK